jgi:bifunctional ADP-heptose synthase (sugar kinase/adenylyltransferase)
LEAAHIANIAGGLVVIKRGTATVTRDELLEAIRGEASGDSN